ncbi:hypothetical protein ACLOJK_035442 [Asimina triloba]
MTIVYCPSASPSACLRVGTAAHASGTIDNAESVEVRGSPAVSRPPPVGSGHIVLVLDIFAVSYCTLSSTRALSSIVGISYASSSVTCAPTG